MKYSRLASFFIVGAGLTLGFLWLINSPSAIAQSSDAGLSALEVNRALPESAATPKGPISTPVSPAGSASDKESQSVKRLPRVQSQVVPAVSALASAGVIANGGFENGPDGAWTEFSAHGWDLIVDSTTAPVPPHSGDWLVWLGGEFTDTSSITQSVVISAEAPILTYWEWIGSADSCGFDWKQILISGNTVVSTTLCTDTATGGWVRRTLDLSAYVSQAVDLEFRVDTDATLNSNLFLDDIALGSSAAQQFVYLPLCLKNYCAQVHYFDNFSDASSGWPIGDNATATYGYLSGEYQILVKNPNNGYLVTPGTDTQVLVLPSDYRVEVDARQASSNVSSYGLRFAIRWNGNDMAEAYQFLVFPDTQQYMLNKYNGTWQTLVAETYSAWVNPNLSSNHLAVQRVGSSIALAVNGHALTTVTDGSFTSAGRDAGVRAYSYEYRAGGCPL